MHFQPVFSVSDFLYIYIAHKGMRHLFVSLLYPFIECLLAVAEFAVVAVDAVFYFWFVVHLDN